MGEVKRHASNTVGRALSRSKRCIHRHASSYPRVSHRHALPAITPSARHHAGTTSLTIDTTPSNMTSPPTPSTQHQSQMSGGCRTRSRNARRARMSTNAFHASCTPSALVTSQTLKDHPGITAQGWVSSAPPLVRWSRV
jgi:hypothetical protein